ncbi:MAG: phosphoenolpyruvate carboxykinase (ATP) [Candidatus Ratteibacteria bacterium]|nr:phosphoenolpyruvate carboxykinase (ATP) [Candidatus Ratteibacteria bacterium]
MELNKVLHVAANEIRKFYYQPNLRHIDDYELEEFAANYGIRTQHGSLVFTSNVQSSSLPLTIYVGGKDVLQKNPNAAQSRILRELPSTLAKIHHYAKKVPFACVEKRMCNNDDFNLHCALFTSLYKKESIRLPFLWGQSVFPAQKRRALKLHLVCIPEWPASQRQIIVFPELGITYVLGSDYFEDIRGSFLRMAMYFAKTNGMQAVYGASKIITCYDSREKKFKNHAALFIGPSRIDKTLYLTDNFSLSGKGEDVKLLQDGVLFVRKYNQVLGAEKIFAVKVQGLESRLHSFLYRAALNRKTNFENVVIDHQGRLDFQDSTITDNGKALIQMRDLIRSSPAVLANGNPVDSENINVSSIEKLDSIKVFIMAKFNSVVPPVSKLEPRQAASVFILGESVEDNKIIGEPASNPYLIGSAEEEVGGFLNFLENNKQKAETYLINTGSIGELAGKEFKRKRKARPKKIDPEDILHICKSIFKQDVKWEKTRYWQVLVPKAKENVNLDKYKAENFYGADDIKKAVLQLRSERQEHLKNFPKLPVYIKKAVI